MCCFKTRFSTLVSQIFIMQTLGFLGSFGSVDAQSMMGEVHGTDDKLPPSEAVTRNGWHMGYSESNLSKHSVHYRGLTQRQEITQQNETFACSSAAQLEGLYNKSTKQWIIDDDTVFVLDSDIQAIINCSTENDAILFRAQNTIKPQTTITIPWTLTISGFFESSSSEGESIAEAMDKVRFTCPEKGPLIVARASAFVVANMVIVRCNSSSDIVHLDSRCTNSPQRNDQSHFLHMSFLRNSFFQNAQILNAVNSFCAQLMLENVQFIRNRCSGEQCISLPSDSVLQDVKLSRNQKENDSSVNCSVFSAQDKSQILARNMFASNNGIRVLHILDSTLTITDSIFRKNLRAKYTRKPNRLIEGGVLFAHLSRVSIHNSTFNNNYALTGGVLNVNLTQININNCRFGQNNANHDADGRGGAIRCLSGCLFNIRSTSFIENTAKEGGAIYTDNSSVSLEKCQFIKNSANTAGACTFSRGVIIEIEGSMFEGNRANKRYAGTILAFDQSEIRVSSSLFQKNSAITNGGALDVSGRSKLSVNNSNFTNNSVRENGGAIQVHTFTSATLLNSNFTGNKAKSGGALFARDNATVDVLSSRYNQNDANSMGGSLYVGLSSKLNVTESYFVHNYASDRGGAMYLYRNCTISISSTLLSKNEARQSGGAICITDFCNVSISNCRIRDNKAEFNGGGVSSSTNINLVVSNSSMKDNRAEFGGALFVRNISTLTLVDSKFAENTANFNGGCLGLMVFSNASLLNCSFSGNTAEDYGGALYVSENSSLTASNIKVTGNSAKRGGALCIDDKSVASLTHSVFTNNSATTGGAISTKFVELNISNCMFLQNNVSTNRGGAIRSHFKCTLNIRSTKFVENFALNGGAFCVTKYSNINITESSFVRNKVRENGGALHLSHNCNMSISDSLLEENESENGGAVYASKSCSVQIFTCQFQQNKAKYTGGGVSLFKQSKLSVLKSSFKGNQAQYGGVFYSQDKNTLKLEESKFENNSANFNGGCLEVLNKSIASVVNCSFNNNKGHKNGGAVNVGSSNITMQSTEVSLNNADKDCGGIRIFRSSFLNASSLSLTSNEANDIGGGICIVSRSSFLCYSCLFENNTASKGAGMYGSSKNQRQSIKAQLQKCTFIRNFATSTGGGLEFENPQDTETTCLRKKGFCGSIVLLNTLFIENSAEYSGSVVQLINPGSVLVSCDFDRGRQKDFVDQTSLPSLLPIHPNAPCNSWKRNHLLSIDSSTTIGTYGLRFNFSLIDSTKGVQMSQDEESVFWLKNVQSGKQLPDIQMILLDGFGNGPAPTIPRVIRVSVQSNETFFQGIITINITAGRGVLSEVVGFVKPGDYSLRITPQNIASIEETTLMIQVRDCVVGETPIQDRVLCQECGENSYNFDPNNENGCTSCPETASCEGHYIVPKDGYWHKGPCNSQVKRCVLEDACTYDKRKQNLTDFSRNFIDCSFNNAILIAYGQMQCSKGYEGTLCGSCAQLYSLSLRQKCSECPPDAESIITMIVLLLYLLVICSFTIRGALPYQAKHTTSARQSRREILVWNTTRSVAINIQMVEMMRDGYVPPDAIRPSTNTQRSSSSSQRQNQGEMTGWKTAEIFKIMINFLQVTAALGGIAVNWTDGIMVMFKATEYVGALTTVALSRPIDCILSSDSALVRSVWRTLINLLVPGIVIIIYIAYWGYIKVHKSKAWAFLWKRALLSIIVVIYISYLGLTKLAARVFHCVRVFDSENHLASSWTWYWAVDTAIKCYGKEHSALISVGVIVLALVTLCFPFISAFVITNYKDQRQNPESWINETMGFLHRAFKDRFMYWESIVMLRKAFLSVIIVFSYPLGGQLQASLALLLLMLSLCWQVVCMPYREEFSALNRYESASLFISSVTLILGQFLDSDRCSSKVKLSIVFFIVCLNVTTFLFLLITYLVSGVDHMRATLEEEGIQIPDDVQWWGVIKIICVTKLSQWRFWAK